MTRQFVVACLGRVGIFMVGTLYSLGHEVLAIDEREDKTLFELDLSQKMGLTVLPSSRKADQELCPTATAYCTAAMY